MTNPIKFRVYQDKAKPSEWRWQITSTGNGRILADSGEGYKNHADCLRMVYLIRKSAAAALVEDQQTALVRALLVAKPNPGTTILGM